MPTKDFFSGADSGRENTRGNRTPQEQDDPFAGMQKLDFDFLDQGTDGADDAVSFDALFDALPQEPDRGTQPASEPVKAAPFVFDEPASGTGAAERPKAAPSPRPAQPAAPAQSAAPSPRAAQPAPSRRAAQASFDLSALEKEIDRQSQTSRPRETEGYAPLAFDFDLEEAPPRAAQSAAPAAAQQASATTSAPRPAETARPAAPATPFVVEPQQTAAPSAPAAGQRPAAPAASPAPAAVSVQRPAETAQPAASTASQAPAAVSAARPATQTAAPSVAATRPATQPVAPSAAATRPAAQPGSPSAATPRAAAPAARRPVTSAQGSGLAPGQGSAQRPASRSADFSTISFSLGDVSVEAPTMAFMPIEQINSAASAQAQANRRAAEKSTPAPQTAQSADARAARMVKERNIGAAVFSALMEQDAPPAPAARGASGASRAPAATMEWPSAPRAAGDASRAPKPINWRAPAGSGNTGAASAPPVTDPAPQPAPSPVQTAAPAPQPAATASDDGLTPLDFNFDDLDSFGSIGAAGDPARRQRRGAELLDLYDSDPDSDAQPPRRSRSGKGSGSDGGRAARRPSGSGKGGVPPKSIFAWCGILLVAVLVILFFVVFGDKEDDSSSSSSSSVSASMSDLPQSESLPAEPVVTAPIPRDEWYMVLANRNSVLPMDFAVAQTETVGEALVDARIAESLRQMVNDAAAAGIKLKPTNGYRTVARQQELWNARVQKLMTENGISQAEAETRALDYTSRAGTSDHNTGLGLDIVSEDHPGKDIAFADTAASAWLLEHAAEYGFIQRYPSDKTAVTGMDYEPYHYRYVGVEQAQLIKASGLCLEEYLAQ